MSLHQRKHPEPVDGCFGCKLTGISFGIVPGGYRDTVSTSMHDSDAIMEQWGHSDGAGSAFNKERVKDMQTDFGRAYRDFQEASSA